MDNAAFALVALIAMEIVLGIDNIVFIALLTSRLPKHQQALGRNLGLGLALISRLALLWLLVLLTDESNTFFSGALFNLPGDLVGISLEKAATSSSVDSRGIRMAAGFPVICSIEKTRTKITMKTMRL